MATPEHKVKTKLKAWLKENNAYYFMPVQTGMGAPGLDFYCCISGQFVAIETKAPGKELTARQQATAKAITAAHGKALVATLDDDGVLDFKPCG